MACKKKIRSINIIGRRWFAKTCGNTYHSAEIIVNGESVARTGMHYGYGDQYAETACKWLEENGYISKRENLSNGGHICHWRHIRENLGITYTYEAIDVQRKKDL